MFNELLMGIDEMLRDLSNSDAETRVWRLLYLVRIINYIKRNPGRDFDMHDVIVFDNYLEKLVSFGIIRAVSSAGGVVRYVLAMPLKELENAVVNYVDGLYGPVINGIVRGLQQRGCYLTVYGKGRHVYLMIRCRGGGDRETDSNICDFNADMRFCELIVRLLSLKNVITNELAEHLINKAIELRMKISKPSTWRG
ncbi:hypothetical protein [Vulcanisaeta souniana]|uniref:hypothetical protein n=1 Tax=Vulcanisaeta souniana TaxID=164452 RepID=UPI000A7873AE|nr:hypothetical protein [Vulcanisaeta souniana]